eukprot:g4239.t1
MQRRKSFRIQSHVAQTEHEEITRTHSFTLEANRNTSVTREGVQFLQGHPLKLDPSSPKKHPWFQFPGSRLLRVGLGGFRRHKRPVPLKSPCVWVDTPKEDHQLTVEDSSVVLSIKGDSTNNLDKSFTDCGTTTEAFDIFPEESVLSLPLRDTMHPTVFTLSRLSEVKATARGGGGSGTPLVSTERTECTTRRSLKYRSSMSSCQRGGLSKTEPVSGGGDGLDSSSSWGTIQDMRMIDHSPFVKNTGNKHPVELDSDFILRRIPRRSFSSMDFSRCASPYIATPSDASPHYHVLVQRPRTRFDSRIAGSNSIKKQIAHGDGVVPADSFGSDYSRLTTPNGSPKNGTTNQVKSFRSDQFLFHESHDRGQQKLLIEGALRPGSSHSERNLCIGQRPDGIKYNNKTIVTEKNTHVIRRMKTNEESLVVLMADPLSSPGAAESQPELDTLNKGPEKASPQTDGSVLSTTEDSQWDNNDCNSVLEDPKSLAMWFDWLEERSDLTRKEILYRMKCQKAFIQDANENLAKYELMGNECRHILNATMKDRMDALRKKYLQKTVQRRNNHPPAEIDEDELVDINLDEGELLNRPKQQLQSFKLDI